MRTGRLVGNGGNGYGLGYGYGYGYGLGHGYGIGVGILLACVACGSGGGSADTGAADVADAADETPDAAEVAADPGITPPVPWGAKNRGFTAMRGIVHLHSLWSHDGCFGGADEKRPADDSPFMLQCLAELRAAPCLSGIDFVFQTDHPSNVKHRTFEEALHFQPANGDEILKDAAGRPLANRIKCPDGSLVPHALFYVGAEGKKNMPIGVSGPVPMEVFETDYGIGGDLAKAQAAIATLHGLGGYAFAAHTEESSIPVERMMALPLDGMEIFNVHAMLMSVLGDLFAFASVMDRFMAPGPDADLALLPVLKPVAKDPEKFDYVAARMRLSHAIATDIHRNVELPFDPPPCKDGFQDGGMCENFHTQYPNFAAVLRDGGPFILNDGERLDSYRRTLRWFSNHAMVAAPAGPEEIRQAIGKGRSFSAFDMMGMPSGFDFFAYADGKAVEMGEEVGGAKAAALYVRAPAPARPPWWKGAEIDWSSAIVKTRVIQATEAGAAVVKELDGPGATAVIENATAGAWRVEAWVTPKHLKPALAGVEDMADREVPYLYSNALFLR